MKYASIIGGTTHFLFMSNTKPREVSHISNVILVLVCINLILKQFQDKSNTKGEMERRVEHVRKNCFKNITNPFWLNLTPTGRVWIDHPHQLYYCIVPKAGCTFWKQLVRFLTGDFKQGLNIQKPSSIDRNFVHYGGLKNITVVSLNNPVLRMLMATGKSFMVTRNPYSRLWSGFIDKFLLPDFWRTSAKYVMTSMRPNATAFEKKCPRDVTFEEFLAFITKVYPKALNEHWDPVFRLCGPCHTNYEYIIKQESFTSDSNTVLDQFGIGEYKIKGHLPAILRNAEEIRMISSYNFKLTNSYTNDCFEFEDVAKRLWLAFQYNGYIHRDIEIPLSDMRKDNFTHDAEQVFLRYATMTMQYQEEKMIDLSSQKRMMMREAFLKIPVKIMEQLKQIYAYDFELFGYKTEL